VPYQFNPIDFALLVLRDVPLSGRVDFELVEVQKLKEVAAQTNYNQATMPGHHSQRPSAILFKKCYAIYLASVRV
jgi:hypothetical protein